MFIVTAEAGEIDRTLRRAVQIAHHVFVEVYHLPINLASGKTEITVVPLGKGARAAK